jgi:hypothetical protein
MPTDRYTKLVLTVIAGALVALVVQNAIAPAQAQFGGCGAKAKPCFVTGAVLSIDVDKLRGPEGQQLRDAAGVLLFESWDIRR